MVFPAADALMRRGIPLLFATGYEQSGIPARFHDIQRCEKPMAARKLCGIVATLLSR